MPLHLQTSSVNMQNDQVRRRSIDTRSGRAGAERMKRLGWARGPQPTVPESLVDGDATVLENARGRRS